MTRRLLISDLDGTLLGNDASLAELVAWLRGRPEIELAYSSGRSPASVMHSVRAHALPEPVALIGNVGTEIRLHPGGEWLPGWPPLDPRTWSAPLVRAALAREPRLQLQPDEFQSVYKVSYYLYDAAPTELDEIQARLESYDLACELVYSSARDLDVLPRDVDKGSAAAWLAAHLDVTPELVIVCGDSGNDAAMFRQGFRGVIVGNALPELKAAADEHCFLASRPYAGGVLQGLQHWLQHA